MEGPIEFTLKQITTEQFAIVQEAHSADKEINLLGIFRFGVNVDLKMIVAYSQFRFEQIENPFIVIEVGCHFSVNDLSWNKFLDNERGKVILDKGFLTHLLSLTIGTTRGVLHSKTEGSQFNQFLLPTINVTNAMQDAVLEFDLVQQSSSE